MAELRQLLVDGRAVDHPTARNRGVGRQTLGMLSGLLQVGAPVVALFETSAEAEILASALPGISLAPWRPATLRRYAVPGCWFLSTQLMLHPIPLDPVPTIVTEAGLPVAAVMHDVIPERYPEQYQVLPTPRAQVRLRGMLTRTLDALLAVSAFAADTAAEELRFPRDRIRVIGAGVDAAFRPATADPWPRLHRVLTDDGRKVVLMVSGTDGRKNTQRMLQAWGLVPAEVRATHRLVVAAAVDGALLHRWQGWAADAGITGSVAFTGGVSDDEMVALHQVATLAVMPSTEEGFGLPVLEAAACACPVIVSGVSSLPEVLAEPAAEFDPLDPASIAAATARALTDPAHRAVLAAAGERAVQRWTWANTGAAVAASLAELGPRRQRPLQPPHHRVAFVGRFDGSPVGRANEALADAFRDLPSAPELHLLVDNAGRTEPAHAGRRRFPARALGRFVHASLFDDLVALSADGSNDGNAASVTAAIAERHHALVWPSSAVPAAADAARLLAALADRRPTA